MSAIAGVFAFEMSSNDEIHHGLENMEPSNARDDVFTSVERKT